MNKFSLVVLAYLGFLGFINVLMFLPGNWMSAMGHFDFFYTGETHDLPHELVFALIVGTAAVGLLSQLWKPKENFAGQLLALIVWVVMILTAAFTKTFVPQPLFIIFGGLTIIATILHPSGRGLFTWFHLKQVNRRLLALVVVAAIPLIVLSFTNINLQIANGGGIGFFGHNPPASHDGNRTTKLESPKYWDRIVADEEVNHEKKHVALGHYRNIAAFSFMVILIGVLASFRPPGWWLAVWVAGLLPISLGIVSLILPEAESSLGMIWSFEAIAWGIVFIVAAKLTRKKQSIQ